MRAPPVVTRARSCSVDVLQLRMFQQGPGKQEDFPTGNRPRPTEGCHWGVKSRTLGVTFPEQANLWGAWGSLRREAQVWVPESRSGPCAQMLSAVTAGELRAGRGERSSVPCLL